jgi:hypothetical protein
MKAYEDGTVQSHLISFGFVKDYTVWTLHGERVDVSGGASSGVSSSSMMVALPVNQDPVGAPVPPSAAAAPAKNDNSAHDFITVEDILQDMPDGADGGGDGQEFTVKEPEDVQLVEDLVNHID